MGRRKTYQVWLLTDEDDFGNYMKECKTAGSAMKFLNQLSYQKVKDFINGHGGEVEEGVCYTAQIETAVQVKDDIETNIETIGHRDFIFGEQLMEFSKLTIKDSSAIDTKTAQKIVQKANEFGSDLELRYLNKSVDLKSILGIMSLAILEGAEIEITAYGEDAITAINEINKIISK